MALSAEKAPAIVAAKPKKARAPKDSKPKKSKSYPSYFEMIGNAIAILKERKGSSQYAITKFIEEKQKNNLPLNFKKMLLYHLKKLVAAGKLVKIKNSFKIPVAQALTAKRPPPPAAAAKPKPKPVASGKPKAVAAKRKAAAPVELKPAKVAKKATSVKPVKAKKPKSMKSPAKKAAASKKVKKVTK